MYACSVCPHDYYARLGHLRANDFAYLAGKLGRLDITFAAVCMPFRMQGTFLPPLNTSG